MNQSDVDDLSLGPSTHEETDTRLFCQGAHASCSGLGKIMTCSVDTDVVYEQLSNMAFVDGYLTVMSREPPHVKDLILHHLQELMKDCVNIMDGQWLGLIMPPGSSM